MTSSCVARSSLISVLESAIQVGYLTVIETDGTYTFGTNTKGCNTVTLRVLNDDFWTRVLMCVSMKDSTTKLSSTHIIFCTTGQGTWDVRLTIPRNRR